jgi:long-chain fatty acid transport protein
MSSLAALLSASGARASNITEVGEGGSEQMQRGGAWIARASDPIAVYYNPAGLAGQPTRLSLETNVIIQHTCMTRVYAARDTTKEPSLQSGADGTPNGLFPRVCNDIQPFPNPQLAFNFRVSDRVGVAFAVLGPNSAASKWSEFTPDGSPSPQRYLLLSTTGSLTLTPTIGIGAEVADGLRLGASFQWGIANLRLRNASAALNFDGANPAANDVRALLQVKDYFIPGFTLGALYSALEELDIAAWYKWSAPIDATGDLVGDSNYFTKKASAGDFSGSKGTDTSYADCGYGATGNPCGSGKNAHLHAAIPMEAKLGFRYHKPNVPEPSSPGEPPPPSVRRSHVRDPLAQDLFDTELDFTWANNSALDSFQIRFPGDANGEGVIPVNGIVGGTIPPNADVKKGFKDVFGVRLGGDYNVLPDQLAVRAGAFAETSGQDQQYQSVDFAGAARLGFALGGTYRIRFSKEKSRTSALEIKLGYGHIFFAKQDQGAQDRNASGLPALAGVACNPATSPGAPCASGTDRYRTIWPVNLGTIWNSVNTFNVGVAYRF